MDRTAQHPDQREDSTYIRLGTATAERERCSRDAAWSAFHLNKPANWGIFHISPVHWTLGGWLTHRALPCQPPYPGERGQLPGTRKSAGRPADTAKAADWVGTRHKLASARDCNRPKHRAPINFQHRVAAL